MEKYSYKFTRTQTVHLELKRMPTAEEMTILLGVHDNENIFSLDDDLIDWENEEIIEEDYSSNVHTFIPKPEVIK